MPSSIVLSAAAGGDGAPIRGRWPSSGATSGRRTTPRLRPPGHPAVGPRVAGRGVRPCPATVAGGGSQGARRGRDHGDQRRSSTPTAPERPAPGPVVAQHHGTGRWPRSRTPPWRGTGPAGSRRRTRAWRRRSANGVLRPAAVGQEQRQRRRPPDGSGADRPPNNRPASGSRDFQRLTFSVRSYQRPPCSKARRRSTGPSTSGCLGRGAPSTTQRPRSSRPGQRAERHHPGPGQPQQHGLATVVPARPTGLLATVAAMALTRVIVVRHGQSTWNAVGRWQGHADAPLSPSGALAGGVRGSSPPSRGRSGPAIWPAPSRQRIILRRSACRSAPTPARERDAGDWTGLTRDQIEAGWPRYLADHRRPNGFEVDSGVLARVRPGRRAPGTPARWCSSSATAACCGPVERFCNDVDRAFPNLGGRV